VFVGGLALLAAVGAGEYGRMLRQRGIAVSLPVVVLGGALLPPAAFRFGSGGAWGVAMLLLVAASLDGMWRRRPDQGPIVAAAAATFGGLYVGGLLSFGVPLRLEGVSGRLEGTLLFFLPVCVTWLVDTAAYFGGRAFGRTRLAPRISPNKTREGAFAGLLAGPLAALTYATWAIPTVMGKLGIAEVLILGLAIALAAILGDLVESALKRECGAKDASRLIPGHGGLLDRLDSLLWAIPVAHLFLVWRL